MNRRTQNPKPRTRTQRPEPTTQNRPTQFWRVALIILAGVSVYANSLTAPFIFDDEVSIVQNAAIRAPSRVLSQDRDSSVWPALAGLTFADFAASELRNGLPRDEHRDPSHVRIADVRPCPERDAAAFRAQSGRPHAIWLRVCASLDRYPLTTDALPHTHGRIADCPFYCSRSTQAFSRRINRQKQSWAGMRPLRACEWHERIHGPAR